MGLRVETFASAEDYLQTERFPLVQMRLPQTVSPVFPVSTSPSG
jgi:hypothetical protein